VNKTKFVSVLLSAIITLLSITVFSCSSESNTKKMPISKLTEDQVKMMLVERLQNLAVSPEAKEYVNIVLNGERWYSGYFKTENAWEIGIDMGKDDLDTVKKARWFSISDIEYFASTHWNFDQGGVHWNLFSDRRLVETGSLVESDISQLNKTGVLR
jgi:hypothetical protein